MHVAVLTTMGLVGGWIMPSQAWAQSDPTITITSPNGGESWLAGTTHSITWTSTDPTGMVEIELYKAGSFFSYLGSAQMENGTFSWTISPYLGDGTAYTIRIYWSGPVSTVDDFSDAPFTVTGSLTPPTLTVTRPNGGEVFQAGTTETITWTATNPEGLVNIELLKNGQLYMLITAGIPMTAGTYSWDICPYIGNGNDYAVRVVWLQGYGLQVEDLSNSTFTITGSSTFPELHLTAPNGGESWPMGSTQTITWSSVNPSGTVSLTLYKDGQYAATMGFVAMSMGQIDWQVCPYLGPGSGYTVTVSMAETCGSEVSDASDASFTITAAPSPPVLVVTSPNGGESWQAGTSHSINWTCTPTYSGTVNIILNKGGQYYSYVGSATASTETFNWTIDSNVADGTDYTVVISMPYNCGSQTISDSSDAPFTIAAGTQSGGFKLTSPNGGETWQAGTTHAITWDPPAEPGGSVSLWLLKNGQTQSYIGMASPSAGTFAWAICEYIGDGSDYGVQINYQPSMGMPVTDSSDAPFTIAGSTPLPSITVTSPNGGETWMTGSTHQVTWSATPGIQGTVSIMVFKEGAMYAYLGDADVANGTMNWTINGQETPPDTDYQIFLSWNVGCAYSNDSSDADFTIEATPVPPSITAAVSRKTHGGAGSFDMDVRASGAVECRKNGPTKVIVTFSQPVFGHDGLDTTDVSLSSGTVTGVSINGSVLIIDMTDVADATMLTIGFAGIENQYGLAVSGTLTFGSLLGDVNKTKDVNLIDVGAVKAQYGNVVSSSTFKYDLNIDGSLNLIDVGLAKSRYGNIIP